MVRLLRRHGLSLDVPIAHLPDWACSRYLVPIHPAAIDYAFTQLVEPSTARRRLATRAARLPRAGQLFALALPWIGLVARRPGAPPLFEWLFRLDGSRPLPAHVIAATSWRGAGGAVVLHRLAGGGAEPAAVAKVSRAAPADREGLDEASLLTRLGPTARGAGARVPEVLHAGHIGSHAVLLQSPVLGESAARVLSSTPNRFVEVIGRVSGWLERWSLATAVPRPLGEAEFTREILAPAVTVAPLLESGRAYVEWLSLQSRKLAGTTQPLVATHNDLTMRNVFLGRGGELGVVDWETSRPEAFPLVDFFYAITDAAAATRGYTDRPAAFGACFAPDGIHADRVREQERGLLLTLGIGDGMAELCRHACWLNHAVNEHLQSSPRGPRPFLTILKSLIAGRCERAG